MLPIHQRRRQPFVTEAYLAAYLSTKRESSRLWSTSLPHADSEAQARSIAASLIADNSYQVLSIQYSAGEAIPSLRAELETAVKAYEHYQNALATYEDIPNAAPLGLGRLDDYERCMQLIGLCYLLHRRDLLPRIAALEDPAYAAEDVLYEELLAYSMPGRYDVEMLKFVEVYDPLIQAMYAESDERATEAVARYVDNWYPWFELVPWHDSHLRINGTEGDYFGYWAFEAGAVALLCEIDDSAVDHIVYPKDLVAWARENKQLSEESPDGQARLRCMGGQPCPQSGYWFTPARPDSRQRFAAGTPMPEVGGAYGATLWQWDGTG